jgi:leucyl aminopeptidase
MEITVSSTLSVSNAVFVFLPEENKKNLNALFGGLLPKSIEKEILARVGDKDFEGVLKEMLPLFLMEKVLKELKTKKFFLVGLGKGKDLLDHRKAAGLAIRQAKKLKAKKIVFILPKGMDTGRAINGGMLGNYEFKVGDTSKRFSPEKLTIVTTEKINADTVKSQIALGKATLFTQELVNLPANIADPDYLVEKAKEIAKLSKKSVSVTLFDQKKLKKMGAGALLGVAQGAASNPHMVVLEYNGGNKKDKPLAFVGKGVCFDSGGYNIKPTGRMETMHQDMAGAATVLGIFHWLAETQPKQNFVGVIGLVENMVSHSSYRPGDIITAMNGQTIRITNTDAEGRLVLADCLHYCHTTHKPSAIIDFATLTGAAVVALGLEITAIMGNDKPLLKKIEKAAESGDEQVWELPITDFFREKIKDTEADLQNWTDGVQAGSSMAGAFLQNFVGETPWVHVDFAGTAYRESTGNEISPKGGTGVMLRTMTEMILNQ